MKEKSEITFEEIFEGNKNRIHYHINKLRINDPMQDFYVEGMYAMWVAYKKYEPNKGPMATYFNFSIRNHLIDTLRKQASLKRQDDTFINSETIRLDNGNRTSKSTAPILEPGGISLEQVEIWDEVKSRLTENQWKWVESHIIQDMPLKEIAVREGVSIEAVKSWGKAAKRKLRKEEGFRGLLGPEE